VEFFLLVKKGFRAASSISAYCDKMQSQNLAVHHLDEWSLYYSQKQLTLNQLLIDEHSILIIVGTLIYKNKNAKESLAKVKEELDLGSINKENWYGNFGVLYAKQGHIQIIVDTFAVQSVYSNLNHQFYTSSFLLSQLVVGEENLTLNRLALTENIITGSLIGPDTIFNEIERFEPYVDWNTNAFIKIKTLKPNVIEIDRATTYNKAVDLQVEYIEATFQALSNFTNETGVDSGITSGLDSRLLLAFMQRNWDNYQLHTHYRNYNSGEVSVANQVAQVAEVPLVMESVVAPEEKPEGNLLKTMNDSFLFTDGLIRMHGFWYEEYNTAIHRIAVLQNKRTGISGVGGEQYRNMDQFIRSNMSLNNFVKYQWIYALSGKSISNKEDEYRLINRISEKIRIKLDLGSSNMLSFLDMKRVWNEVFIPARLGGRNNAENKISYFFSPFILSQVSSFAYQAIPHVGHAHQFQIDMLKKISPKLAKIPSDYGFDFRGKQPNSLYWKALYQSYTPNKLKFGIREIKIRKRGNPYYKQITEKLPVLARYVDNIKKLNLPINYDKLEIRPDMTPLLMNVGCLIEKMSSRIGAR